MFRVGYLPVPAAIRSDAGQLRPGPRQLQPGQGRPGRPAGALLHRLSLSRPARAGLDGRGPGPAPRSWPTWSRCAASASFHLVTGFAEKDGDRCFNSSLLSVRAASGAPTARSTCSTTRSAGSTPATSTFEVDRVRGVRVGMMICFDWVFPEATRTLALQGADLVAHPSNLVLDYCQRVMPAAVHRERRLRGDGQPLRRGPRPHGSVRFTGRSQIAGPRGEVIRRRRRSGRSCSSARSIPRLRPGQDDHPAQPPAEGPPPRVLR